MNCRHDFSTELSEIGKIARAIHKGHKHGPIGSGTLANYTATALESIDRRLAAIEKHLSRIDPLERRVTTVEGKVRRSNPARPR